MSDLKYRHHERFKELYNQYLQVSNYERMLSSLVLFDNMYRLGGSRDPRRISEIISGSSEREYKRSLIYNTKKDLIKTFDEGGNLRIILTSAGKKVFFSQKPLYKLREQKWDKKWTVVMYDIPIKSNYQRRVFKRKMTNLGFGVVQKSIMVTPLPVEEELFKYINSQNFKEYILVFKGNNIMGKTDVEIANEAFKIDEVNELYKELYTVYNSKSFTTEAINAKNWIKYYLATVNSDPHLPYELLNSDWKGDDCKKIYKTITKNQNLISKLISKIRGQKP